MENNFVLLLIYDDAKPRTGAGKQERVDGTKSCWLVDRQLENGDDITAPPSSKWRLKEEKVM